MAAPDRQPAQNVAAFSINGQDYLGYLENATFKADVKHEEAKGVGDFFRYPWATDGGWDIEGDFFAGTHSGLMNMIGASVTILFTVGGTAYSGQALVTTGHHAVHQSALQKMKLTFLGQGQPTIQ